MAFTSRSGIVIELNADNPRPRPGLFPVFIAARAPLGATRQLAFAARLDKYPIFPKSTTLGNYGRWL